MKWWTYILSLALGLALGYFLFSHSSTPITITKTEIDTVYQDTGTHTVEIRPEIRYSTIVQHDSTTDTVYIIKEYYTINYYGDTVVNDSSLTISYNAKVFKNRLDSIDFKYSNNRPIQYITHTEIIKPPKRFYLGGFCGGSADVFDYGGMVGYSKGKLLYTLQYGVPRKDVRFGVMFEF